MVPDLLRSNANLSCDLPKADGDDDGRDEHGGDGDEDDGEGVEPEVHLLPHLPSWRHAKPEPMDSVIRQRLLLWTLYAALSAYFFQRTFTWWKKAMSISACCQKLL